MADNHSDRVYNEQVGAFTLTYDFDDVINFVQERIVFVKGSFLRESHAEVNPEYAHLRDIRLTDGNQDFRELVIKNRKCVHFTMIADNGFKTHSGCSLIKMSRMGSRLLNTLKYKDLLTTIEVVEKTKFKIRVKIIIKWSASSMFGYPLQEYNQNVVCERNFRQSIETPRLLAGAVRNKFQIVEGRVNEESEPRLMEDRKVYIDSIEPDEIVRKSERKLGPGNYR